MRLDMKLTATMARMDGTDAGPATETDEKTTMAATGASTTSNQARRRLTTAMLVRMMAWPHCFSTVTQKKNMMEDVPNPRDVVSLIP
jgi:hypothetical protein